MTYRRPLVGTDSMLRERAVKEGYRSWFEFSTAQELTMRGVSFEYETTKISFIRPEEQCHYIPDFRLPNGIYIETKGDLDSADRKKMLLVKEQHPELDIRFVFANAKKKIYKGSLTTCAQWCDKYGFKWAHRHIPDVWIQEKPRGHLSQGDKDVPKAVRSKHAQSRKINNTRKGSS